MVIQLFSPGDNSTFIDVIFITIVAWQEKVPCILLECQSSNCDILQHVCYL